MMIFKAILLCALVAAPALASSIKGYSQARLEETKGDRKLFAPVEQQKLIAEQQRTERIEATKSLPIKSAEPLAEQRKIEQAPAQAEHRLDELTQQREEVRLEETKGLRYEAKPQVREPSKTAPPQRIEQQRDETRYEQQREERIEQQQRDFSDVQQQIELKEEQRRYEEPALVQPILPLTVVEEAREQQIIGGTKGAAPIAAPLAEAEPYSFSYQVEGSSRSESGDTKGVVRGQYTLQGVDGSSRLVDYIADQNGFRATINTNEFGTEAKSPANIALRSSQPNAEDITLRLEGKTREDLAPPAPLAPTKTAPVPAKPENWSVKSGASLPLPLPQAPLLPLEESIKGQRRLTEEPAAKGQRLVQAEEPAQQQQFELSQAPAKGLLAEQTLRAPKAVGESIKYAQTRSGFESATAHRNYRPQQVVRVAPAVALRAQPVVPLVRSPVSRAYLQRERYPASPVQANQRRGVSFYSPSASLSGFDDELPAYEHVDQ